MKVGFEQAQAWRVCPHAIKDFSEWFQQLQED